MRANLTARPITAARPPQMIAIATSITGLHRRPSHIDLRPHIGVGIESDHTLVPALQSQGDGDGKCRGHRRPSIRDQKLSRIILVVSLQLGSDVLEQHDAEHEWRDGGQTNPPPHSHTDLGDSVCVVPYRAWELAKLSTSPAPAPQ